MALPGFLGKIFSGGAGNLLDSAGKILDNVITNKEELAAAKLELEKEVNRHFEALETNALKVYEAEVQDRDSARKRETAIIQAGGKNYTQNALAIVGVAAFFIIVTYIIVKGLAEMNPQEALIVGSLLGTVGGIATTIFAYYFGSSKSSATKDKAISEMVRK